MSYNSLILLFLCWLLIQIFCVCSLSASFLRSYLLIQLTFNISSYLPPFLLPFPFIYYPDLMLNHSGLGLLSLQGP